MLLWLQELRRSEWRSQPFRHLDHATDTPLQYITLNLSSLQQGLLVSAAAISLACFCPLLVCLYRVPDKALLARLMEGAEQGLFRGLNYGMAYGADAVPLQLQHLFGQAASVYKVGSCDHASSRSTVDLFCHPKEPLYEPLIARCMLP